MVIIVYYFLVQTRHQKKWNFSRRFNDLLLSYFSVCKNKRIKQKTNLAASKMKVFMILVDGLFGKLNNVTKNHISDDPRSTSLSNILKKRV